MGIIVGIGGAGEVLRKFRGWVYAIQEGLYKDFNNLEEIGANVARVGWLRGQFRRFRLGV